VSTLDGVDDDGQILIWVFVRGVLVLFLSFLMIFPF